MSRARRLVALCGFAALAACRAVGPDFSPPVEAVPPQYSGSTTPAASAQAGAAQAGAAQAGAAQAGAAQAGAFWWRTFHDAELDRLETLAREGNLDLQAAYFRIAEARAQVQAARAQGLPSLNASAQYTREQLGLAGILKAQGAGATLPGGAAVGGFVSSLEKPVNLYQLGLDASWELDLFGRVRRSVEAANASRDEALESRNDLVVTLLAEVAHDYLQLRAGQMLQQITRDEIAEQRLVTELTQDRQRHGLAAESDVDSAQAQLSTLESQLPQFDQSIGTARHALAVLTGRQPVAFDAEFVQAGELPPLPDKVEAGVPAALARRRPDIRRAEAQLHAATAQVGVSVASLYPEVSLTGSYGLRNLAPRYLFDWSSRFYTGGGGISVPIFRGGALVANIQLAKGQAAEAALAYRQTVLGALQEVEDALTALHDDAVRTEALRNTVGADQRALEIDTDAYRRGLLTYITVLTVQLQSMQARQQLAQALLSQSLDVVKLYKALGGGWDDATPPAAVRTD